jgi:hypothetical protein
MTGREADIVERLRHHVAEAETDAVPARSLWRCVPVSELREAADIIERLSQENEGLRTALAECVPFAAAFQSEHKSDRTLGIVTRAEALLAAAPVPVQTEK